MMGNIYTICALPLTEMILILYLVMSFSVAYPGVLFRWGVQQIQLRTEDRENGDLGAVAH
jgi:hypothetical protein